MDALRLARLVGAETVAAAAGVYGLIKAVEMGSTLFAGISFALVGMSLGFAMYQYNNATAE